MPAIELVVADTLLSKAFVPMLMATATPMPTRNIGGSSHDSHMMNSTIRSNAKAMSITPISAVVSCSPVSITTLLPYFPVISLAKSCWLRWLLHNNS